MPLRLLPPPDPPPMPLWQAWARAHWWLGLWAATAAFEAWQRAMGMRK